MISAKDYIHKLYNVGSEVTERKSKRIWLYNKYIMLPLTWQSVWNTNHLFCPNHQSDSLFFSQAVLELWWLLIGWWDSQGILPFYHCSGENPHEL